MENCAYDSDGNLLASTFSDYTPITAINMPDLLYGHMESPSPMPFAPLKVNGDGGAVPGNTYCAALHRHRRSLSMARRAWAKAVQRRCIRFARHCRTPCIR